MKGKVIKSFVDGKYGSKGMDAIIDIPSDVDWVKAGLVEPIKGDDIETASTAAPEKAVIKKSKPRTRKPRAKKADTK